MHDAAVGVVLCMLGQYQVFPSLAALISTRRRGMLAARCCSNSTEILERVVHTGDCMAKFIPNMYLELAVWRSYRLLHLVDVALPIEINDYPGMVRFGVIVLVLVFIPKMLLGQ